MGYSCNTWKKKSNEQEIVILELPVIELIHWSMRYSNFENGFYFQATLYAKASDPTASVVLKTLDTVLRELLSLWFTVGLLDVQRITWESPCNLLQKVGCNTSLFPLCLHVIVVCHQCPFLISNNFCILSFKNSLTEKHTIKILSLTH